MIAAMKRTAPGPITPRTFQPEAIPSSTVPHLNTLAQLRARVETMVAGRRLVVEAVRAFNAGPADFRAQPEAEHALVCTASAGQSFIVHLPRRFIDTLLAAVGPGLAFPLAEPALSLLLECALADALQAIEAVTGGTIMIVPAANSPPKTQARTGLHLQGRFGEDPVDARIVPAVDSPDAIKALLAAAGALIARIPLAPRSDSDIRPVSIVVAFEAGRLALSMGALRRLALRDTLLPDSFPFAEGAVQVRFGRHRLAEATLDGRRLRLASRPLPSPFSQERAMLEPATATPRPSDDADLDAIEVELVFELGRHLLEIAELRSLDAGYVFDLKTDPAQSVTIMAHGRRIGRGEIVSIGDGLGVRIVRLFGSETAPGTVTAFSPKDQ